MNASERYMGRVAAAGCMLCKALGRGHVPAAVHHVRDGQGMAQRASHYLTVGLCHECHQGPNGLHGNRSLLRIAKVEELDLLAMTIEALAGK